MVSLGLVLISSIVYLKLNKFYQFLIFSLCALLPFSFGNVGSIPKVLVIEWLNIIAFIMLINKLAPLHSHDKLIRRIKFKGIEIFIFAFLILLVWTIYSYINNEILSQQLVTGEVTGIRRTYFNIFNYILLFFTTIIFIVAYYDKLDFERFFKIILYLSVIIGITRIFSYFLHFSIPLIGGLFDYDTNAQTRFGGVAYRLSGLEEVAAVGIPALFSYYVLKRRMNMIFLLLLLGFLFLSGARTILIGTMISIIVFSFFFLPKNFMYLIGAGGIALIIAFIFLPQSFLQGQTGRLTTLNAGNFMGQDAWRGMAWQLYLQNFLKNPIWGKGIGTYQGFIYSNVTGTEEFARAQLFAGGHGSYFSMMSTFGVGGLLYFIIIIFGGVILAMRKIKLYVQENQEKTAIAVFCFMYLIIRAIDCITAHSGFDVSYIFFVAGLIASLTVLENSANISSIDNSFHEEN
jgi:O-Antigen ligase